MKRSQRQGLGALSVVATDSIAAIATPPGTGGIGIIRISGGNLQPLVALLSTGQLPSPRLAVVTHFLDSVGCPIDEGIVIYFPAPHSFTGEDVLELHAHGGVWVMHDLLARCLQLGARQATAGEFTLRAYWNDKLDLAQAEAVADLINANNAVAARAAAQSLTGVFSRQVKDFIQRLRQLRADLESGLDFSDDDVLAPAPDGVATSIVLLTDTLQRLIEQSEQGALLLMGTEVVIAGATNVGKSSLLNCLANEEAAIVTNLAGTTRDLIERSVVMAGMTIRLVDSAGLRSTTETIEQVGIDRATQKIKTANLVLSVFTEQIPPAKMITALPPIHVCNKVDLTATPAGERENVIYVSAKTGDGTDALRAAIVRALGKTDAVPPFSARARHVSALKNAYAYLQQALVAPPEVAAAWIRDASDAMEGITGTYDDEDLLGDIFAKFCVGK